jgi:hypothetical protein
MRSPPAFFAGKAGHFSEVVMEAVVEGGSSVEMVLGGARRNEQRLAKSMSRLKIVK